MPDQPPLIDVDMSTRATCIKNVSPKSGADEHIRRLCDTCVNFLSKWPEGLEVKLPERKPSESLWKYEQRVRAFGETLELFPECVCLAGIRMAFRVPFDFTDNTWGFFKDRCRSYADKHEVRNA